MFECIIPIEEYFIIYLIILVVFGALLFFLVNYFLKSAAKKRTAKINNIKEYEAVPTKTPYYQPEKKFQFIAKKSVQGRFTIFRRIFALFIISGISIALIFPFMDHMPKALISVIVTASAIIIGMAARPFIENLISGIAITVSGKLHIGDTVRFNDKYGTIEDISSTHTVIKLWNWQRYILPNSITINTDFLNYTLNDRWIWSHVEFWIAYNQDIEEVKKLALKAVRENPYFKGKEEPSFWVMNTDKEAYNCWVAGWTASPSSSWMLKTQVRETLVKEFMAKGIRTYIRNYADINDKPDHL